MNIKCVIIDDEPLAIKVIETHLKEFDNIEVLGTFNSSISALPLLESGEVDVVFLDINMPAMNGLDFLKNVSVKSQFIITTAYREFGAEAFDLDVLDYLVKPIPFPRFLKSINKLTQSLHTKNKVHLESQKESYVFLKVDKKLVRVMYDAIYYVQSLKDYIKVVTKDNNYIVHKSLTSMSEELPTDKFLRIHRSFVISIDKINAIEGNSIDINNVKIPIGRKYVLKTKQILLNQDIEKL